MKPNIIIALVALLTACGQPKINQPAEQKKEGSVKRFGMVTGLKPEKEAYYRQLHAAAWPAVLKKIAECNIRNYSIYIKRIEGKPYLFSYFEYTGNDFDADMKKMAADTATQGCIENHDTNCTCDTNRAEG